MLSKIFFALTVGASCILAQSSTESSAAAEPSLPASLTPCILNCVTTAAAGVGCTFSNTTCVCASSQFQDQARQCLQTECTPQELQTALGLQAQECGSIGATPSGPSESVTGSATSEAASSSAEASVSAPVSVSGSSSASQVSNVSVKPTSIAPASSHSAAGSSNSATGSNTASTPSQTSTNAAIGKGDGLGLFSLIVVGFFGLLL